MYEKGSPHPFIPLEGDPAWFCASTAQPVHHFVLQQRGVTKMLVDGVGGHFGDVLCRLGLNIEGNKGVSHKVMDRLKPLLPNKVLPVIEQSVVEGLEPKSVIKYMVKVAGYPGRKDEFGLVEWWGYI